MSGVIVFILRILSAVSLYAFLGIAVYNPWRELKVTSSQFDPQPIPEIILKFPDESFSPFVFDIEEITIGRDASCSMVIADDTVSTHHARMRYHHKQWWLEDLQSTNGTFINDERVYTPTVVVTGDEITFGQVNITLEVKSA